MPQSSSRAVLVVDSNEVHRYPLERVLRHKGFRVHSATTGGEALEHIAVCAPDLVLLSCDAQDALTIRTWLKVQAFAERRKIPVVLYLPQGSGSRSGDGYPDDYDRLMDLVRGNLAIADLTQKSN